MVPYEDSRIYGDYRGEHTMRSELTVEDHGEQGVQIHTEDGDSGGRGAERNWSSHMLGREEAFVFHAWLTEVLYGT